jgi:hypothetical protein
LKGNENFVVKEVRKLIEASILPSLGSATRWSNLVPKKVNIFVWRLLLDRLPVKSVLCERGLHIPLLGCVFCSETLETCKHVFGSCHVVRTLYRRLLVWLDVEGPFDFHPSTFLAWVDACNLTKKKKKLLVSVLFVAWWVIWNHRNEAVFKRDDLKPYNLFDSVLHFSYHWFKHRDKKFMMSCSSWLQNPFLFM